MRFLEQKFGCTARERRHLGQVQFLFLHHPLISVQSLRHWREKDFFFLVCREEREERKKFGVLLHQRTGNKWCNPGKAFVPGNVASSELCYFNVFSEGAGLVQALLMAKGSLRECSPALPTLLLGMGVCGGKF